MEEETLESRLIPGDSDSENPVYTTISELERLTRDLQHQLRQAKKNLEAIQGGRSRRSKVSRVVFDQVFPCCLLWQCVCLCIITAIETWDPDDICHRTKRFWVSVMMFIMQVVNMALIVVTSVKLWNQYRNSVASAWFLVQSYLSTQLMFAGVYTTLAIGVFGMWEPTKVFSGLRFPESRKVLTVDVFSQMAFYSMSTACLCGCSSINVIHWYGYLVSAVQLAMSFIYFSAILGQFMQNSREQRSFDMTASISVTAESGRYWIEDLKSRIEALSSQLNCPTNHPNRSSGPPGNRNQQYR